MTHHLVVDVWNTIIFLYNIYFDQSCSNAALIRLFGVILPTSLKPLAPFWRFYSMNICYLVLSINSEQFPHNWWRIGFPNSRLTLPPNCPGSHFRMYSFHLWLMDWPELCEIFKSSDTDYNLNLLSTHWPSDVFYRSSRCRLFTKRLDFNWTSVSHRLAIY